MHEARTGFIVRYARWPGAHRTSHGRRRRRHSVRDLIGAHNVTVFSFARRAFLFPVYCEAARDAPYFGAQE
ncbi:hypothetical protein PJI17_20895 [Mycobacterium kansasii]|uniref:Uncharacterized protein n=1 Tax=Mycobacterium kansasii TaxID=1768 RepID=A0A1V3WTV6_MYCKA|nr:hypothetical protein BZL30_6397 [Mycobacterium kansasii]